MKRITSILLAAALLLALGASALASEEETPAYRLTQVTEHGSDGTVNIYTLIYNGGGVCPDGLKYGEEGGEEVHSEEYSYDAAGRIIGYTADTEYGMTIEGSFAYDEDGNLAEQSVSTVTDYSTSRTTYTYTYDENGLKTGGTYTYVMATAEGDTTQEDVYTYAYDEQGRLVSETDAWTDEDGNPQESVVTYEYDEDGTMISSGGDTKTFDEQGRETSYSYDWGWSAADCVYTYAPLLQCTSATATYSDMEGATDQFTVTLTTIENMPLNVAAMYNVKDPELTFDDNGYLVKADAGDGRYTEFTYEPVP